MNSGMLRKLVTILHAATKLPIQTGIATSETPKQLKHSNACDSHKRKDRKVLSPEAKIVIINGPRMTGKTSIIVPTLLDALHYHPAARPVMAESMVMPLKLFIGAALHQPYERMNRNIPLEALQGHSINDLLINLSEAYLKPRYGKDVFARLLMVRLMNHHLTPEWIIIDGCGFEEERQALRNAVKNVITVKVERPGYDFRGDSRTYLSDPDYILPNHGDEDMLRNETVKLAQSLDRG